mmetsp:Transcript_244/g.336  ORF Transcript_244/g.336 Transcript_244/m.336 type:complete len:125 (+) Transcript_244:46-420(+)
MASKEPEPKKQKRITKEEDEEDDDEEVDEEYVEGEDEEEEEDEEAIPAKRNADGEAYFEISSKRRASVRKWKGKVFIDFREFYEKDGKDLPGKKGISFSIDQYEMLSKIIKGGSIDKEIKALGK